MTKLRYLNYLPELGHKEVGGTGTGTAKPEKHFSGTYLAPTSGW